MKSKKKLILLFLMLPLLQQASAQMEDDSFTVFCTGNHDSTGHCLEAGETNQSQNLECIMVPGNIVDCKNEHNEQIDCILITATSAQAEFSCRKNTQQTINSATKSLIERTQERPNILPEVFGQENIQEGSNNIKDLTENDNTTDNQDETNGSLNTSNVFNNPF